MAMGTGSEQAAEMKLAELGSLAPDVEHNLVFTSDGFSNL